MLWRTHHSYFADSQSLLGATNLPGGSDTLTWRPNPESEACTPATLPTQCQATGLQSRQFWLVMVMSPGGSELTCLLILSLSCTESYTRGSTTCTSALRCRLSILQGFNDSPGYSQAHYCTNYLQAKRVPTKCGLLQHQSPNGPLSLRR